MKKNRNFYKEEIVHGTQNFFFNIFPVTLPFFWCFPERKLASSIVFSVLLLFPAIAFSQNTQVTGTILDSSTRSPISGVNIVVKGKTGGTNSDMNGQYTIQAAPTDTLLFTYVGMIPVQVAVAGRANIPILLQSDADALGEVVVIGYGSVAKPDLTGAVGVAPVDDMAKAPVSSFADALSGRIAGVTVNASDGQPGGDINIVIRGQGSLTQSTAPLFVIDGFPIENPDPVLLNPEEIESMSVLKDASSTAIYGSRGANGVILIQTKRGIKSRPIFSISSSLGYQFTPKPIELMSPYEFVKYQSELSPTAQTTLDYFADGKTLEDYRDVQGIDFQDHVLRKGVVQIHNLALRGGNDNTKYSISGSIYDQKGVIINTGLKRHSGRVTLDQMVSRKFKTGVTVNYTRSRQFGQVINQGPIGNNPTTYVLARAWMYRPVSAQPDENLLDDLVDEDALTNSDFRINPVIDLNNQYNVSKTSLTEANGYVSYDISNALVFKSTAGIRHNQVLVERFYNSKTSQGGPSPGNVNGVNGYVSTVRSDNFSNENTLNYKKTFNNDHTLTGLALFAVNEVNTQVEGYGGRLLPNENLGIDGIDEGVAYNPVSSNSRNTLVSYAGRLDYNYKSKYIITGTFRADGSSKFVNHWGYFPGAAIAWNMQNEKFFASGLPFISTSKIRMSYGSNGNNRVGDFDTYARLAQNIDGYSFNNSTPIGAVYISSVGNPELRWEKQTTIDIGYEIGFLKNRITLEVDVYRKTSDDLLLNATLPPTTGFGSAFKNIGKLENKGLEFTLNTINVNNSSFQWRSSFNISFNKNKVLALTEGQTALNTVATYVSQFNRALYRAEIGQPTGQMIGYIWEGNYQYADFNETSPGVYVLKDNVAGNGAARNTIQPGDIKYRDLNGDLTMTDADVTFIGRGQPIHTGGFTNNFSYRNFNLNIFFQWSQGNDIYNANRLLLEGNSNNYLLINQYAAYEDRWTPENQDAKNYRTRGNGPIGFHSSRVVEDGSYLRLKTLSLSYSLPQRIIKKASLSSLTFDVSAQNVLTFTSYSGMDPEVSTRNNVLQPGYDYSSYPKSPTVVFGIKAAF